MIALALIRLAAAGAAEPDIRPHDVVRATWYRCLRAAARAYAPQAEPAETVVGAAFGACAAIEADLRTAFIAYVTPSVGAARAPALWEEISPDERRDMHDRLLSIVLETRAAANKPPP